MNWNREQEAQINYGRSQMHSENFGNSFGGESRPFGNPDRAYVPQRHHEDDVTLLPKRLDQNGNRHIGGHVRVDPKGQLRGYGINHKDQDRQKEKGHMAFLNDIRGNKVRLVTVLGKEYVGSLKGYDDSTISLRIDSPTAERPEAYQNRVFFKQNLVEFAPVIEGVTFS